MEPRRLQPDDGHPDVTRKKLKLSLSREEELRLLRTEVSYLEKKLEEYQLKILALESTLEGVVITDSSTPDNAIIYHNKAFTTMTGYSESDSVGKNCRFLQGKDTDPAAVSKLRDGIRARERVVVMRNYRNDGTEFWNEFTVSPVAGTSCFIAVQSDVSEQHRRTEMYELRDRALHSTKEAVLICDLLAPDVPIIYCNDGFLRMTGYSREEVLGRNCRFLQGADSDPQTIAKIRMAISLRLPLAVEILNYKKNGTAFLNQFSLTPVFDAEQPGRCTHYIAIQYENPQIKSQKALLGSFRDLTDFDADGRSHLIH